jgi:hypothetical protein
MAIAGTHPPDQPDTSPRIAAILGERAKTLPD